MCLLESESWFLFFSSNEGAPQIQLSSSFSKVGTQKDVRPWTQTNLQHSPLILLLTDLLLLFFLCSLLLSLWLSPGVFFWGVKFTSSFSFSTSFVTHRITLAGSTFLQFTQSSPCDPQHSSRDSSVDFIISFGICR